MRKSGLPQGTWVVVADGEKALFLINDGDGTDMNLRVRSKEEHENPPTHEQGANRPGRFNDGPSVQRSAVADTDWHALEKERFARELADMLYKDAHRGAYERLVLVASRPVLSELRDALHREVTDRVIFEMPKVLTNHPIDEIESHLARDLAGAD